MLSLLAPKPLTEPAELRATEAAVSLVGQVYAAALKPDVGLGEGVGVGVADATGSGLELLDPPPQALSAIPPAKRKASPRDTPTKLSIRSFLRFWVELRDKTLAFLNER